MSLEEGLDFTNGYLIRAVKVAHSSVKIIRWIARIWSIGVFVVALLIIFTPDPYAIGPVPTEDWFLLSLWGVAILGLLVA
jgi:hypothetical protein